MKMSFIESASERSRICEMILRSLPDWFGIESAILDYIQNVQTMDTWVMSDEKNVAGFISVKTHNQATAEEP